MFDHSEDDEDGIGPVPVIGKKPLVGAMFCRRNKKTSAVSSMSSHPASAATTEAPAVDAVAPIVEAAFAAAKEIADQSDFVPTFTTPTVSDKIASAHAASNVAASDVAGSNDESDPDFSADLSGVSSVASTIAIRSRVNETEAMVSITPPYVAAEDQRSLERTGGGNTPTTGEAYAGSATMEDAVDPNVSKSNWVMRGPKKSTNLSNVGVDFSHHMQKSGLVYVHALFAVPKGFPDGLDVDTSESGVSCFAPYELNSPSLFFEAGVSVEGKMMNELVDTSDALAVRIATSCIVVSKDIQDANGTKRLICAFLRIKLSDNPIGDNPQLLEQWNTFKARCPKNSEVIMSIQRETAKKLCEHPVAKQHMCDSVVKCFATSRLAKKKEAIFFDYKRLDDDTKADIVVTVASESHISRKRSAVSASSGAVTSTDPSTAGMNAPVKKPKATTSQASLFRTLEGGDASSSLGTAAVDEPPGAYSAAVPANETTLAIYPDNEASSNGSFWDDLVNKVSVVLPPFPNAPVLVNLPYDPAKITLVPCGTTSCMLQFTM